MAGDKGIETARKMTAIMTALLGAWILVSALLSLVLAGQGGKELPNAFLGLPLVLAAEMILRNKKDGVTLAVIASFLSFYLLPNGYLNMKLAELYPLLRFTPFPLMVLVPAFTLKSRERRALRASQADDGVTAGARAVSKSEKRRSILKALGLDLDRTAIIPLVIFIVIFGGLGAAMVGPFMIDANKTSKTNTCINNMRMIDSAKEQLQLATGGRNGREALNGTAVDVQGMCEYMKGGRMPKCPNRGQYFVAPFGSQPYCTVHGELAGGY